MNAVEAANKAEVELIKTCKFSDPAAQCLHYNSVGLPKV